jgi:hypothetical protein
MNILEELYELSENKDLFLNLSPKKDKLQQSMISDESQNDVETSSLTIRNAIASVLETKTTTAISTLFEQSTTGNAKIELLGETILAWTCLDKDDSSSVKSELANIFTVV